MIEFKYLKIGLEVYFVDVCLDVIKTKIAYIGKDMFSMKGCAYASKNSKDSKYLFLTKHAAINEKIDEFNDEIMALKEKVDKIKKSSEKIKDLSNFSL